MAICNCVYIVLLFTVINITVFLACGELDTVLPYYVPLYYTDIPLKLTALPQLVLHAHLLCEIISLLRGFWTENFSSQAYLEQYGNSYILTKNSIFFIETTMLVSYTNRSI